MICEAPPAGEPVLRAIEAVLGYRARCNPVWSRDDYELALSDLSRFDAIVLGNQLGWSDGLSLVEDLAALNSGIPIVMITDTNGADLVAAGFRLGMHDFLRSNQLDRLPEILQSSPDANRAHDSSDSAFDEVRRHEERHNAISSVLADYVFSFFILPDQRIENEWRSDGVRTISGYSPEEVDQIGWLQIVHPEDRELIKQRVRQLAEGESPIIEYRIIARSGEVRWLREHSRPIWDPAEERYVRFVGSAQDITRERLTEVTRSGQMRVLELIATGAPIEETFDEIISLIELVNRDVVCALHRVNETTGQLTLLRASKESPEFLVANGHIDPDVDESCQAAAIAHQQVIVLSDLETEDCWIAQSRLARFAGVESVVVLPVPGSRHNVLGTITVCRRSAGEPGSDELERLTIASRLTGIAIEKVDAELAVKRAELQYRRLAEEIPAITFVASADDRLDLSYLSPQAGAMTDPSLIERHPHLSMLDLVHPDDRRAVAVAFQGRSQGRTSVLIEFRVNATVGWERWLQCSAVLIDDDQDDRELQPKWQGILLNVTARRCAEQALRESQTQYRALFDNNPHIVLTLDLKGRFTGINPAAGRITGYLEEDLIGRPFTSVLAAGELERVWRYFRSTISGQSQQFDTEVFTKTGKRLHLRVTCVPYVLDGNVAGVSAIAEDISEQISLQRQLAHQAFHDGLTGLPNRVLFGERLDQSISAMKQGRYGVAVLFVDLDNFKVVNDSLGHESGDKYLKVIANWMKQCVGPLDTVARFGGDEFAVLLVFDAEDPTYVIRTAERIGAELNRSVLVHGHEINTGVSIGISICTDENADQGELLRHADIALYQAKRAGSDTLYRVFEESMNQEILDRLEVERDLRRAIRRNEFDVHYQPIIDLRTDRIVKLEALVRWRHPRRGLLNPGHFLAIAEETGQVADIDAIVLRIASRDVARWNHSRPGRAPLRIGVNMSVRNFRQADLTDKILQVLQNAGCDPSWVTFEITESTMMQDVSTALDVLQRLRDSGVGFSIDDFGTGYSSLAYLQRLPLDTLKIDRSFIDGLGGDQDDELMVRTIISLASALSLEVIAEGIETPLQLERARSLGCDRAQGFLIARPAPFEELLPLLMGERAAHHGRDDQRHTG